MNNEVFSILAIDDDKAVLDSYATLFMGAAQLQGQRESLDELEGLIGGFEAEQESATPLSFQLDRATSGEEGVAQVQANDPYAVILLDMRMPGGWDGMETARRIRALDNQVRIVLITAFMDHTLEQLREEIGLNFAYLQKPFERNEVMQLVLLLATDWAREQRLVRAEQQAAEAVREADRANQAKDDFLASMSHELRTPLTSLLGNCDMMVETGLDEVQSRLQTSMEVSGKSLLYLINDILDSSKIEAGHFEIDEVEYNPLELLDELQHIFSNRASEYGVTFEIVQPQPLQHLLLGDGRRLSQVLINLLSNAVKFSRGGKVTLEVGFDRAAGSLDFRVEDSGIGMDEETLGRIFKPFEQADRSISGRFGGTGLGLHISWNLVRLMGGKIEVRSELGKGSCFRVSLPLREAGEIRVQATGKDQSLTPLEMQGRVLIAEDTPELQLLERRMIENQAPTVTVELAGNGQEAVEMAAAEHYDLIFMDMQMPVMDGLEATRTLRSIGITTPVVALTANVMQKQRDQFFEAGCSDFLPKPIDRFSLRAILEQYLVLQERQLKDTVSSAEHTEMAESAPPAEPDPLIDAELMALFRTRSAQLRQELLAAYESGDWKRVAATTHTIKGSGGTFGFPQLTELGRELQAALDEDNFERAGRRVERLVRALEEV